MLGAIAFLVATARGLLTGGATNDVLLHAWLGLIAFSAAGYVVGRLAEWIIDESVRTKLKGDATPAERSAAGK